MPAFRSRKLAIALTLGFLVAVAAAGILILAAPGFDARDWPRLVIWTWSLRRVPSVQAHDDLRWVSLRQLDLRTLPPDTLPTLGFNQKTRWPSPEHLPKGFEPGTELTNAMDPGLGIRALHRQGITGRGVAVAVVDFNVVGRHPEYADRLAAIHRPPGVAPHHGSMHGPAVLSLLAGHACGTAPEARVHFFATTDGSNDAAEHARAVDQVLELNRDLPAPQRIRVISISAAPSGRALYPYRNGDAYDRAVERAEAAGVLVIDGTEHHGWVGPCALDPADRQNPERCRPVLARGNPTYFAGRLLCPTSPRTTAEEYGPGLAGYQHCGLQRETQAAAGSSWSMPYAAGVAALGWQVRPELGPRELREALMATARRLPGGETIIDPSAFIERLRGTNPPPPATRP